MRELTEELEAFRVAREAVGRGAATLSDMRAEQMQFDRRMDARFSGVQDVLEKLVDRLGRSDGDVGRRRAPRAGAVALGAPPARAGDARHPRPRAERARARRGRRRARRRADRRAGARPRQARKGAKSAAINAHIAAARRAANAAAADSERREEMRSGAQGRQKAERRLSRSARKRCSPSTAARCCSAPPAR